jgi:hypothetical protein
MTLTPANRLPKIITGLGLYRMRNNKRVRIDRIDPASDGTTTRFNCKGNKEINRRGKDVFGEYGIWHPSGCATAFTSPFDIVEKIDE